MIVADVSKLRKGKSKLGTPPSMDEAATSLAAPEIAPAPIDEHRPYIRRDGRSARKTNRTLAFATRVTPEFDESIRDIAEREDLKIVEVLEAALEALKEKRGY
ncbi:hypothetical protein D5F51_22440 (plasmid) [Yersinia hibernica]|uniref:Stability/partitioning determinant n=1 Tax=Yersinia hibernica TaxID=2339259 RepID=A0ABX5R6Q5_9GAMM|nr:hypothetical protein [Yersinia enterocolitica]QAX81341.1 hypothetical protein D5F51_22440 [Yersinia hibernica]CNF38269.1 Uncharacterised protein [Yersinia kristensenii]EKN6092328.1 hypothetical protein [Yersinia enterocolitica]EKN6127849.1 hypothetical protein [Yersinia enterocolitica]